MDTSQKKIPTYWDEFFECGYDNKVIPAMGICGEAISDSKTFKYGIGCVDKYVKEIPDGFEVWTVPANTWAIFKCVGAMPHAIQDMWKRIYSEWLPNANYEIVQGYDSENYFEGNPSSDDYISEIWLPVKEKVEKK